MDFLREFFFFFLAKIKNKLSKLLGQFFLMSYQYIILHQHIISALKIPYTIFKNLLLLNAIIICF